LAFNGEKMEMDNGQEKININNEKFQDKQEPLKNNYQRRKPLLLLLGLIILVVGGWFFFSHQGSSSQLTGNVIGMSDDNLAQVNGETISDLELDRELAISLFMQGIPANYQVDVSRAELLDSAITKKLLLQEAEKKGFFIGVDEVNDLLLSSNLDQQELTVDLQEAGINYDDFIFYLQAQLAIQKFLNTSVTVGVTVNNQEIEDYYKGHPDEFVVGEKIKASHILVNSSEEAQALIEKLRQGADFAQLAKDNSIGPSAPQGGDLGYFTKGDMVQEFETAAFALKNSGDFTTTAVQTQFGYHVIMLTGREEASQMTLVEASNQIKEGLLKQKENYLLSDYIQKLSSTAQIKIYDVIEK